MKVRERNSKMKRIQLIELTPLQIHSGRYSDKYTNKAMLDAIYWRMKCYECGDPIYLYDPDDHNYIKCKCGARKRTPINIVKFTPEWSEDQRRRDGFKWLFTGVTKPRGEVE